MADRSSWKTIFRDYISTFYNSKTADKVPVKTDHDGSPASGRYIAILVLASFFAFTILCILVAAVWKWARHRKDEGDTSDDDDDEPKVKTKPIFDLRPPPRHVSLVRADSSLSEVDGMSRDSSLPPTPLSPLSEEDSGMFPFEGGRLEFSVIYESENECLKATVIQGHGFPTRYCVFFVEVFLLPDRSTQQKTSIRYHNPSPIFEETFGFYIPFSELPERTLCFKACELDGYSHPHVIGHVLYSFVVENGNYIDPLKLNLELSSGSLQTVSDKDQVGEVLLSLCYLPTAGRLTLVVLKCRLLYASLNNGLPSPFLKVSLVINRKQVKKIKTSVKSKTLSPVYNEAFIFDVPGQHISKVNLYARVVNDREKDEVMGKIVIGPNSNCIMGVHHWDCMLLSPRKPIAQWHMIT